MATNAQTAQGLALAIFGASAGGYLNFLEAKAGDARALSTELAGYLKRDLGKTLSVSDILANLQLKSGTTAYTAAKAALDVQVAGGATPADAAAAAVAYLFGLSDTTSDLYATATAFKARVDVAVEWSKGAGATETTVTKLISHQAEIDNPLPPVPEVTTTALTVAADKLTGTSGVDTFTGATGLSGTSTLNATDIINGGDGIDTLKLDMSSSFSGFTTGSMKDVETLSVTNKTDSTRTFDATGVTGLTTIDVEANKAGFTVTNLAAVGQTVNLSGANAAATVTVGYATADVTKASTDALNVNLNDAGASASAALAIRAVGIETLNLGSGGTTANFVDAAVGSATKIVVTGTNALTFAGVDATLKTFDASAASGKITADLRGSTAVTTVTTGSADDSVTVGDMASARSSFTGGAGADLLTFRGTSAGTYQPVITGFETVALRSLAAGTTLVDLSKSADVTSIRLTDSITTGGTLQTSGLSNASFVVKQSTSVATYGTGDLNYAGTGSLTYVTEAVATGVTATTGAITAAKADSVNVTVGANTTVGAQNYTTAQDVTQTISGTLGDVTATKAEKIVINSDSTGTIGTVAISAPAAVTVTVSASKSGTLAALDLLADLANTVTISGVGSVGFDTTADLSSVKTLTVSTSGSYSDADATNVGDKSASVTYDVTGVVGNASLKVADYAGTSSAASVVVKGAPIGNNTVNIGAAHANVDITGGIGVNAITLGAFASPSATAPQVVKITTDGIADTDSVTFVAGEDLSGLYATVTLSGVDTVQTDGIGTLTLNAAALSGKTLTLGNGTDPTDVTLSGTTSADTINLADITLATNATLAVTGGAGSDTITAGSGVQTITGGSGSDTITGGDGADVFVYTVKTEGGDTITDFVSGVGGDSIKLTETAFGATDTWLLHELLTDAYAETATALSATAQDLNGGAGTTTTGFIVVGAATGTAGVKIYYTTAIGAATSTNSTLLATLTGINTTGIDITNFVGA